MWFRTTCLYISDLRRVLASGYKNPRFIKPFKRYISLLARNPNNKSGNKRREPHSHILEKGEGRKKDFLFQNPQKESAK